MAGALTDGGWLEICEAAAGLIPDADARGELSACLFVEYPALAYDRKTVAATLRRSTACLKYCNRLAALYREVEPRPDNIMTERDLYFIKILYRRALAHMLACKAIRRANAKRKDSQREWLVSRLCGIWLNNFNAPDLTVTVPPTGGPPRGPLIAFLITTMRQIMPSAVPSPATLRDTIDRERKERENAKQLKLQLPPGGWKRGMET